jgi:nucleoside-diphosphate-sugar epimerase
MITMTEIDRSASILVTGGTGFIASWIIKQLLNDGYNVHATVRKPENKQNVSHLENIANQAPGVLKLFKADLLDPGSFAMAAEGCELAIHTASPFIMSGIKNPYEELIRPALEGTRNVLDSVNRSTSVRRVVLTSSVAAIYGDAVELSAISGGAFTEDHWNTTSSESHQAYSYSKLVAEKEAWAIAKAQDQWDLVTINPSMVFGPSLTKHSASGSIGVLKQLGDGTGKLGVPKIMMGMVDVRDVAQAHIKAGFTPTASGRHIIAATEVSLLEISKILRSHFGDAYPLPKREVPKFMVWLTAPMIGLTREFVKKNVGYPIKLDNSYSKKDLGLEYRPIEETLIEHFQQIIDDKLI